MALTKQPVLRVMVLKALMELPENTGTKRAVLARMNELFKDRWSAEDLDVMPSNGEVKWRNRSAQERRRMVADGLLDSTAYDRWRLTDRGKSHAEARVLPDSRLLRAEAIGHTLTRDAPMMPTPGIPDSVPLENRREGASKVSAREERVAEQRELGLVLQFEAHIRSLGHDAKRWRIPTQTGSNLYTDIYDMTSCTLYEAKGNSSRNSIRTAIGQLLDYRRFLSPASISLLLPEKPDDDMLDLLDELGIRCTYLGAEGFESV